MFHLGSSYALLEGTCGWLVFWEASQLFTLLYLKAPLPTLVGRAMLTILCMFPLSHKAVLMCFFDWCGFTLVGTAMFITCSLWIYYHLNHIML